MRASRHSTQALAKEAAARAALAAAEQKAEPMALPKRSSSARSPQAAIADGSKPGLAPRSRDRTPVDGKQLTEFKTELSSMRDELQTMLGKTPVGVFIETACTALIKNPNLFKAERSTLFLSVKDAARQRLLPDGQEGIILPYLNQETGLYLCKWHVMVQGLRKGLARDNMFVQSQIVCEADEWDWEEGYNPMIRHKPARLGKPRGNWIGVYAIFRRGGLAGELIHQEVMDVLQVEAVQKVSKSATGLLWGDFKDQAWIKTAIRRGIKSVPILSSDVEALVKSDDRYMNWDEIEAKAGELIEGKAEETAPYNPLEDPSEHESLAAGSGAVIDGRATEAKEA